mmetsp:Transcript_3241/g.4730  ORF Transcript_3241/g.4730 Transcript_3241/m.4730 type:complete len:286 (-) Transcript_3241:77-934(-)
MSKLFANYIPGGAGRRSTVSNTEMRSLTIGGTLSWEQPPQQAAPRLTKSPASGLTTTSKFIDLLKSGSSWDDRTRFGRNKKEKKIRDRFAVNIPNRLIFHLIIIFFLIPLTLGMMLLIRALFFGLKEDEEHPLHKKLPHSHIRGSNNSVGVVSSPSVVGVGDVGDDRIEKVNVSSTIDTNTSGTTPEGIPLNMTYSGIDFEAHDGHGHEITGAENVEVDGHELGHEHEMDMGMGMGGSTNQDENLDSDPQQVHDSEESTIDGEYNLGDENSHDGTETDHQEAENE